MRYINDTENLKYHYSTTFLQIEKEMNQMIELLFYSAHFLQTFLGRNIILNILHFKVKDKNVFEI